MFERFTEGARRAVLLAKDEARILNHGYIGTEHLLLGLLRESDGVAARALAATGVSLDAARQQVRLAVGQGAEEPSGEIPFTPHAKNGLANALREALKLRHRHIGTEHILLALARTDDSVAAQVLAALDAEPDRIRRQVLDLLA